MTSTNRSGCAPSGRRRSDVTAHFRATNASCVLSQPVDRIVPLYMREITASRSNIFVGGQVLFAEARNSCRTRTMPSSSLGDTTCLAFRIFGNSRMAFMSSANLAFRIPSSDICEDIVRPQQEQGTKKYAEVCSLRAFEKCEVARETPVFSPRGYHVFYPRGLDLWGTSFLIGSLYSFTIVYWIINLTD